MDRQQIIMHFTVPPLADDLKVMAEEALEGLPEEILEHCEDLVIEIEELPDETVEQDLDLDDPYELMALFRSAKQIAPGVEKKVANEDDILVIYRRPLLDLWCENGENLNDLVRQVMIEELGAQFEYNDDEIDEMISRHYQGML